MTREGRQGSRGSAAARGAKSVVAGAMVSATAIALGSFVLYRAGLDSTASALLSDRFPVAFVALGANPSGPVY